MTIQMLKIQPNAFASVDYLLHDLEGNLLDSSSGEDGAPIEYVHGYGMLVPGLEAALAGLEAGDEREFMVSPEEGYGPRDEELMLEVERSEFPNPTKIAPGDEFLAESPDGDDLPMRVVEVRKDSVVVDANHPLAGMSLRYKVKVLLVRTATEEEIATAARELDEAEEHEHGPDCQHDHDDPALVRLGLKKNVVN
jgi:FKBP-type peptidyl-prolyl cis-trans isomerase SlyD